jgi:hypothetical protein
MRRALVARRAWVGGAVVALAVGCGGRVELDGAPGLAGGGGAQATNSSSSQHGTGGFTPHEPCTAADGTRVCGGDASCPWLGAPECLGYGCTSALDRDSLEASAAGVCWADLPTTGIELCYGCREGDLCLHRTAEQLICVPAAVCEALWDLGVTDVCRYSDKTPYDHQPLPSLSGDCPGGSKEGTICGGSCPPCHTEDRCSGRSPTHPYGVCAGLEVHGDPNQPVYRCSPDGKDTTERVCQDDWACMVYDQPTSTPLARRYGICKGMERCLHAAKYLPGGVSCYDAAGKKITP